MRNGTTVGVILALVAAMSGCKGKDGAPGTAPPATEAAPLEPSAVTEAAIAETGPSDPAPPPPAAPSTVGPPRAVDDRPEAYDARCAQLGAEIGTSAAPGTLKDEQLRLYLRYRYRWPGRHERDTKRQALVGGLASASEASPLVRFWDALGAPATAGEARAKRLGQAKLELAQVEGVTLPAGRMLLYRGLLAKELGGTERDGALSLFGLALAKSPADTWALYEKARLLVALQRHTDAEVPLAALLGADPAHLDGQLLAAEVAVAKRTPKGYTRARELAEAAHARAIERKDAYGAYAANRARAVVYGLQSDPAKRLEALEAAAEFDPGDEAQVLELAHNELKRGKPEKAAARLKACPAAVCGSVSYFQTYTRVLLLQRQMVEAERLVEAGLAKHADNPMLLFWSGRVHEARGKATLAVGRYEAVKRKDPRFLEAYLRLAGIHEKEKRSWRALMVLHEASKRFEVKGFAPNDAALVVLKRRAEVLLGMGGLRAALEVLERIVVARPNDELARYETAKLLMRLGHSERSLPHFERLLTLGNTEPDVGYDYARALIQCGKPHRAIEELKTALKSRPRDLRLLVALGSAYGQLRRHEDAIVILQHAAKLDPNYAPAYYHAGLSELLEQRHKAQEVERRRNNGQVISEEERPDFTRAVIALTNALDKAPENLEYRQTLAEALAERGRKNNLVAALEQYDHILERYAAAQQAGQELERKAGVYFARGLVASKLGRPRAERMKNFMYALVLDGGGADALARFGEELFGEQMDRKFESAETLSDVKAYLQLVLTQYDPNHVRANYYLGRILQLEWDRQPAKKPGDALHRSALEQFQKVIKHGGDRTFPDVFRRMGHLLSERGVRRLARTFYQRYLDAYRRVHGSDAPDARTVRKLMGSKR